MAHEAELLRGDGLPIDGFSELRSVESTEVAQGVVLDFDEGANLVGIDIDRASQILDLTKFETFKVPRNK